MTLYANNLKAIKGDNLQISQSHSIIFHYFGGEKLNWP